ncbi:delta-latroinsectotoxin-Lt1a-like isoform X1 [Chenopodium quinoa]|uniref:delta-latroinsectotoxin-Lt1a-like isoform X1 n=1 Tax=Chenopodium quinoa TaxID=63459 RepID=UPI000B783D77|nr:delta-latroinsectotoxin-Lt1a-like isoform X1 [Chenopodium quinoa]
MPIYLIPYIYPLKKRKNTTPSGIYVIGTEMSAIHMINSLISQGATLSTRNSFFVQENEDMLLSLVKSLVEKNSEVCCWCDADGMTPLLRAAVRSNLPVVDAIINDCPESIEICDPKGKNVLHYIRFPTSLEARNFLEKPEIPVELINQQDDDGNTPMHMAVMNHDFRMVKAMVEHNANFSIENKEGVSAQTLFDHFVINNKLDISAEAQIESKPNKCLHFVEKEIEKEVIKDELMSNDLYEAVGNGKWDTLKEIMLNDEKQFLSRLPDGSNIIHLAIQGLKQLLNKNLYRFKSEAYPEEKLIVDALNKYPALLCQTNHLGKTPLHLEMLHQISQIRFGTQIYMDEFERARRITTTTTTTAVEGKRRKRQHHPSLCS